MKKSLSYASIMFFIASSSFIGMSFKLSIFSAKQDLWISFILAFIVGIIPLLMIKYIASYQPDKSFRDKCIDIFPKAYPIVFFLLIIGIFGMTQISFMNLNNLVTSEFLNKTPRIAVGVAFVIPIILLISKKLVVIPRVSQVLFYFGFILFLASVIGLMGKIDLNNFKPVMRNPIIPSAIYYIGFNIGPMFLVLLFPNNSVKKELLKAYIFSFVALFIISVTILGVFGIYLTTLFRYPEFHVLKSSFEGLLSYQIENTLSMQWIFSIYIFCTIGLKFCNELLNIKKGIKIAILPMIMLILASYLKTDEVRATVILTKYISILVPAFFLGIILLFTIKIFIKKNRPKPI